MLHNNNKYKNSENARANRLAPVPGILESFASFKKLSSLCLMVVFGLVFANTSVNAQTFNYPDTPSSGIAINSGTPCSTPIVRTINVSDSFAIAAASFGFNADHGYRGDIRVVVQHPDGTRVTVVSESGGDSNLNYDLNLVNGSGNAINDGNIDNTASPFYDRTAAPSNPLSAFNTKPSNGNWRVEICDTFTGLDDGTYNRSRLTLTSSAPSPNLGINKSHTGSFSLGSTGTYSFAVTNTGAGATSGTITFSDTLPTGLTVNGGSAGSVSAGGANGSSWSCSSNGSTPQTVTCTTTSVLAASGGSSTFSLSPNIGNTTPTGVNSITNVGRIYGGGDTTHSSFGTAATDSDPTTVQYTVSCSKVYASAFSGGRTQLYELNGSSMNSVFTAPQNLGGLAISSNGNAYYDNATFATPPLYSYNGLSQSNTGMTVTGLLIGEAADAAGNVYYVDNARHLRRASAGGSGAATDLGALVFDAGDTIGPTLAYGDMTFDGNGRLHIYSSINGTGETYLYVVDLNTLAAKNVGHVGPNQATGAAFDASGNFITTRDGGATVVSINLGSSNLLGTTLGTASPTIYDLGSCSTPILNPSLSAVKSVVNVTKSQTPATIAESGDILEYTIVVSNTGNMPSYDAALADSIPASTTYVASSTTLNGNAVADVGGVMPFVTAREINSGTQPNGVVVAGGGTATVTFRVTVDAGTLPAQISNTATISYPTATGGITTVQSVDSNTVNTPTPNIPPAIGLVKNCTVPANCTTASQLPGTELTYQIDFTNTGGSGASSLVIVDGIPENTDYKLGSASASVGTTGLTFAIEFSSDYNPANPSVATWSYTPVSAAGGAGAGYDRLVRAIRWRVTAGSLSQTSPNNTGGVSFVTKIR